VIVLVAIALYVIFAVIEIIAPLANCPVVAVALVFHPWILHAGVAAALDIVGDVTLHPAIAFH
jgi:hypothetical protein